jgi:hypothetical protein
VPWTDFARDAAWRSRLVSDEEYVNTAHYLSGISALSGFCISYVSADLMHCSDLGILLVLTGNCVWELFTGMGGTLANSSLFLTLEATNAASE